MPFNVFQSFAVFNLASYYTTSGTGSGGQSMPIVVSSSITNMQSDGIFVVWDKPIGVSGSNNCQQDIINQITVLVDGNVQTCLRLEFNQTDMREMGIVIDEDFTDNSVVSWSYAPGSACKIVGSIDPYTEIDNTVHDVNNALTPIKIEEEVFSVKVGTDGLNNGYIIDSIGDLDDRVEIDKFKLSGIYVTLSNDDFYLNFSGQRPFPTESSLHVSLVGTGFQFPVHWEAAENGFAVISAEAKAYLDVADGTELEFIIHKPQGLTANTADNTRNTADTTQITADKG